MNQQSVRTPAKTPNNSDCANRLLYRRVRAVRLLGKHPARILRVLWTDSLKCATLKRMTDELIPTWIKTEAEHERNEALQSSVQDDSKTLAELTVKTESPEFWRQFVQELTLAAEGLTSLHNLSGTILHRPSDFESHCRVSVQLFGGIARQTYTDPYRIADKSATCIGISYTNQVRMQYNCFGLSSGAA